jgi:hypothetical protein
MNRHVLIYSLILGNLFFTFAGSAQVTQPVVSGSFSTQRQTIFQGERFELVLTIVSRDVNLGKRFNLTRMPSGDLLGLEPFRELPASRREIGGVAEETRRFRCLVQVKRAGAMTLSPHLHVQVVRRERMLIGSTMVTTPRTVQISPFSIDCRPLPDAGRPADFSGAIGKFTLDVNVSPKDVSVGDLITVTTTIKGLGNLAGAASPVLTPSPGFKQYPQKLIPGTDPRAISAEQIVIPENEQATTIPQIQFSFFDPDAGSYVTLKQGPFTLTFRSAEEPLEYEPYRPEGTIETRPAAETQTQIFARQSVDYFRAATFLLMLLSIVTAVAGIGNCATGKRRWKQGFRLILIACLFGALSAAIRKWFDDELPNRTLAQAATARLAPGHSALESFEIEDQTRVKLLETWQGWVKVADGEKRGWIPMHALSGDNVVP